LVQYEQQKRANDAALTQNEANRKKDEEEFRKSAQEHSDVINAISSVLEELNKLVGSVSGVGKPEHVEQIEAEKRDAEYAAAKHAFVQLTQDETEAMIFAQLATSADQAALAKLIGMITQLQDATKKSLNDDKEHEETSQKAYEVLQNTLKSDNEKLAKTIAEQTANLKNYNEQIAKLTVKIEEEEKLQASKEAELASNIKERQDKENQYNSDKAERDNERRVIERIIKIVEERLANMSKFLKEQTHA